jgi:hypothetical protein
LENVLIENGLKGSVSFPSQMHFAVHRRKPPFPTRSTHPRTLNDVAEELEDNRNKGDEEGYTSGNERNKRKRKE